jgi:two-component system, cell cycle sensor histidine kinase and response regulator CckA
MADRLLRSHEDLEARVAQRTVELTTANEVLRRLIGEREAAEAALSASEEQLRQAQKMEAIGRLAGGVAHDFNNLLSVIMGYAQVLASELDPSVPSRSFVEEIQSAGLRAAQLTKQLLAFGRKQVLVPRLVDLNEIISDMARMLERIIGEDIDLRLVPAPELGLASLDPHQVEQIVMNLVVNARDAMPSGGKLTIETQNVTLDEEFATRHLGVAPGPFVMIAVTDTGAGLDADTRARIFEPFFTTKRGGQGTGLGLSTVFGIVQQSGGTIWVYSEVGRGTTFKIYFPVSDGHAEALRTSPMPDVMRGSETVLLVEDEPLVRTLVKKILTRLGYDVLEAASGAEALEIHKATGKRVDLLLTDVVMPNMSGVELAAALRERLPGLRVLMMSGYTDNAMQHHGARTEELPLLDKPIDVHSLGKRVREALDTPPPSESRDKG